MWAIEGMQRFSHALADALDSKRWQLLTRIPQSLRWHERSVTAANKLDVRMAIKYSFIQVGAAISESNVLHT